MVQKNCRCRPHFWHGHIFHCLPENLYRGLNTKVYEAEFYRGSIIFSNGIIPAYIVNFFHQAVDIFTGYLASLDNLLSAVKEIDRICGRISIPENLYHLNRPIIIQVGNFLHWLGFRCEK